MLERERSLLKLFHAMATRVPAYKDFLKKQRVDPSKIKSFADFQSVPAVTRKNYLRVYPLEKLLWDGTVRRGQVFTATSGSTGAPFYFPRSENIDTQSAALHKLFLDYQPAHRRESTLVVVCFGMGAWIGGVLTYQAFKNIATRSGYPISLFTPGPNKKEIFEGLRSLAPKFDHVILCGYPPFLKDVIDEALDQEIDWKKLSLRIVFAAEAFSEEFREYIVSTAHIKNPYLDTMNIYGSADLGTMAQETPIAILARQLAVRDPGTYERFFGTSRRLPTFAQFHPGFTSFESVEGELLCSSNNALPLVRYSIGDNGTVMSFDEVMDAWGDGSLFRKEVRRHGLSRTIREFPFVSVYERSDFSVKLYGAIIYPEHIKRAMYDPTIQDYVTGKFSMATKTDANHNEYLSVNVELKPRVAATKAIKIAVGRIVQRYLVQLNAEHNNNTVLMPERTIPRIVLCAHEDPVYFSARGKQKWVNNLV